MKEQCREARGTVLLDQLGQDLRYALRGLRKSPGFAITAILTLGLAIGANTAIFSVLNALLLKELPVERPQELRKIVSFESGKKANEDLSFPLYRTISESQQVFSSLYAADQGVKMNMGSGPEVERTLGFGEDPKAYDLEVIGVVKDAKYARLRDDTMATLFFPFQVNMGGPLHFIFVRSSNPRAAASAVRSAIQGVDPELPLRRIETVEEIVAEDLKQDRLVAELSAAFGVLALLLSATGLYGVLSFSVARRTPEMGIRMALGATPSRVRAMVLRETTRIAALGTLFGIPASLAAARLIESLLYGVTPSDALTIGLAVAVMSTVAAAAGYIPAGRAARVQPLTALRYE